LLSSMILQFTGSCPKNTIVSEFSGDISIPKCSAMFCNMNNPLCKLLSNQVIMTWSSKKHSILFCTGWKSNDFCVNLVPFYSYSIHVIE
jgi:hypothetical protein